MKTKKTLTVTIDAAAREQITVIAAAQRISVSWMVNKILTAWLDLHGAELLPPPADREGADARAA